MESKLSKAQQEAKMYVDKHKLEQLIGEMLNSLVHAKDPFPVIYMIKYLAGLCKEDELAQNGIIVKGNAPQPKPLVKFPVFPDACSSLLKKHLSREVWDRLKDKKTRTGSDFYSAIRPGIEHIEHDIGILALDDDAFVQFEPLFMSVAEEFHSWNRTRKHKSNMTVDVTPLDSSLVQVIQVRFSRNFEGVQFPTSMTKKQRTEIEAQAKQALDELGGTYYSFEAVKEPLRTKLSSQMVSLEKPGKLYESTAAGKDWPEGRGVWVNDSGVTVKVNDIDHIQVIGVNEDGDLKSAFDQAVHVLQACERHKQFSRHQSFGYLTSNLSDLGCALQLKAKLSLPGAEAAAVKKWGITANVEVAIKEDNCYEVTMNHGLGRDEAEMIQAFVSFLGQAVELNGEPVQEGNSLLMTLITSEARKSLSSRSVLSVPFKDLIVHESDAEVGLIAKHAQCYSGFMEAFEPIINHLHGLGLVESNLDGDFDDLSDGGLFIRSSRLRFSRNIQGDRFVPGLNSVQRRVVMMKVKDALAAVGGEFFELESVSEDQIKTFNMFFSVFPSPLGGDYAFTQVDWPQGRGIWFSDDKRQIVLVNFRDHIELICLDHGSCFKELFSRATSTLSSLSSLSFEYSPYFGYLTSSPKDIGSAMKASVYIKVPMAAGKEEFTSWVEENHLTCRAVATDSRAPNRLYEISTSRRLKPTEGEVLKDFVTSLQGLIEWEQKEQLAKMPTFPPNFKGIVKTALTKELWERYKILKTPDWFGFYQILQIGLENPEVPLGIGILLPSPTCFTIYQEIIDQLLLQAYNYAADARHSKNLNSGEFSGENLDASSKIVKSTKVSVRRNVANFPLCGGLSRQQRVEVENILKSGLEGLTDKWQMSYFSVQDLTYEQSDAYVNKGVLFPKPGKLQESGHLARDFPEGRSLLLNSDEDCFAWVNEEDHLLLVATQNGGNVKDAFAAVAHAALKLEETVQFAYDDHYGYFATSLGNVGTGLTVTLTAALDKASKQGNFDAFCKERNLKVKKHPSGKSLFEVENLKKVGVSEVQCVEAAYAAMKELVDWEKQLG